MWRVTLHFNDIKLGANQTLEAQIEDLREFPAKADEMQLDAARKDGAGVYAGKYTVEWDHGQWDEPEPDEEEGLDDVGG